jgi:hypothetical protein
MRLNEAVKTIFNHAKNPNEINLSYEDKGLIRVQWEHNSKSISRNCIAFIETEPRK